MKDPTDKLTMDILAPLNPKLEGLVSRLEYKAQNDEMINQFYTETGMLLMEAASALRAYFYDQPDILARANDTLENLGPPDGGVIHMLDTIRFLRDALLRERRDGERLRKAAERVLGICFIEEFGVWNFSTKNRVPMAMNGDKERAVREFDAAIAQQGSKT